MLMWVSCFVGYLTYNIFYMEIYKKISYNEHCQNNKIKTIIILLLFTLLNVIIFYKFGSIVGMLIRFLINIIVIKYLFNDELFRIALITFIIYVIFSLIEMVVLYTLLQIIQIDYKLLVYDPLVNLLVNIVILCFAIMIFFQKKIILKFKKFLSWFESKQNLTNFLFIFIFLFMIGILLYINYNNIFLKSYSSLLNILITFLIIVIFNYYYDKIKITKISWDYSQLLSYVKDYEKMIEEKSKKQHEYRNQLCVIQGIANNKKVNDYILKILKFDEDDRTEKLLKKLYYIPNGGLKGLIHYKTAQMLSKNIIVNLEISNTIKRKDLSKILNKNLEEITKILGVLLDNAMEASLLSKEKMVIINIDLQNNQLKFTISNTFCGNLDISKLGKEGYSTKGKGRGYGLSLIQKIIQNQKNMKQEKKINGNFYSSAIKIDLKK